jgi:hypothetical protein
MLTDWEEWFPNCEPVAHHLSVVFPQRWVRFHSLPGSNRYPENPTEYATLLERHNRILSELARPDEVLVLLTTGWSETAVPIRLQHELLELDPRAEPWRTVAMHEQPDNFPELIAADLVRNVMIVAADCRWLAHPYDGGMDLIVESPVARNSLADRHPRWLAPEWLAAGDARDV